MQLHRRPPAYDPPADPKRPWARDRLYVVTHLALPLRERLRVLCHGVVVVETKTSTQAYLGRHETETEARVPRVRATLAAWLRRRAKRERPMAVTPSGAPGTEEPTRRTRAV